MFLITRHRFYRDCLSRPKSKCIELTIIRCLLRLKLLRCVSRVLTNNADVAEFCVDN